MNRRKFGLALGSALALSGFSTKRHLVHAATTKTVDAPKYWVLLVPSGGIDAVYSVDPKEKREVKSGVDIPYKADEIVDAGGLRLAPFFKELSPIADRVAVVNNVGVNTANHHSGYGQVTRLKNAGARGTPSIFDIIGGAREDAGVASLTLNMPLWTGFTPGFFGDPNKFYFGSQDGIFERIDKLGTDDLDLLARVNAKQARTLRRRGDLSTQERQTVENLLQASRYFERRSKGSIFTPKQWFTNEQAREAEKGLNIASDMQRTLHALENDLCATSTLSLSTFHWDSHYGNYAKQSKGCAHLARSLTRFVNELDKRSNKHGRLSDQTAIVVLSEIGRFPYVNQTGGKDHFPAVPALFIGKWFKTGHAYGRTNNEMRANAINLKTGKEGSHTMTIDDVGATVLTVAGMEPGKYGYSGQVLEFLLKR